MRSFPELRQDLIVREQTTDGKAIYMVKDPISNRFFRFIVFQYYVASLLDGRTSLEAVCQTVERRMNRPVGMESVERFVERLYGLGLLETSSVQERNLPRSLLYYTLPLVHPQKMIDTLYRRVSWCFTSWFAGISVLWMGIAAWGLSSDWDGFTGHLGQIFSSELDVLFWTYLMNIAVIVAHEFAHGLACRHFGGVVQHMGFLFLYFQPGLYTDVSDSYLFPRKRDRMIVMISGMYSGLLIGATAAILWRIADPASWVYQVSMMIFLSSVWGLIFNLNPLIKLDGYFILTDWLDISNLRRKAFSYIKRLIKTFAGYREAALRRLNRKERWVYTGYGISAAIYSLGLILVFFSFLGGLFIAYMPEFTLVGFIFGMATLMRQTTKPESLDETDPPVSSTRPIRRLPFRTLVLALIMALIAGVLVFVEIDLRIGAPFRLRPADQAMVRAQVTGQLSDIFVDEGDTVAAGQPLARLNTRDLQMELDKTVAQKEQIMAQLSLTRRGARPEEIEQAEAAVQQAQASVEAARINFHRMEKLISGNLIAQKDFDTARTDLAVKQAELEEAGGRLRLLRAGAVPEEIERIQSRVRELEATAAHLARTMELCTITSPINGVVATPFLKERIGEVIRQGDLLCRLMDHRALIADIAVPEREIGDIQVGYPVGIKMEGYPSRRFEGYVSSIAPVASVEEGKPVVRVRCELANPDGLLKSEMTGNAGIYCPPRPIGAIMIRRLVRFIRTEFWW